MTYRFNDAKMFMDISQGMALIINSETGIYYSMNKFGTMVFDALIKGMEPDAVAGALKMLKGAPADIEDRFNMYFECLKNYELIVPGSIAQVSSIDEDIAGSDNFNMEISAYDDAQEMLLADPIHEVDEQTGWTPEKASIGYSKEETREREKKVK